MPRETIKQRIALEGGDLIKEALKSLGEAGEKAFLAIKDAAEKAGAAKPLDRLSKTIVIIKERMRDLGVAARRVQNDFRAFGQSLNRVGGSFTNVVRNVGLLTAAVAGATAGFFAFVKAGSTVIDSAADQAEEIGLTIEAYSGLIYAAKLSGNAGDAFGAAITALNRQLGKTRGELEETAENGFGRLARLAAESGVIVHRGGEELDAAAQEAKAAQGAFVRLGVSVRNANGELRPTEDILLDLADAFAAMPAGGDKAALVLAIFGRAGARMLPLLNRGAAGIRGLIAEGEKVGVVFTEAEKVLAGDFNDSVDRVGQTLQGVQARIALAFAPGLTDVSNALSEFMSDNSAAFRQFADDMAAVVIPTIKDLFNALTGNDADVVNKDIIGWRDAIIDFGRGVQEVVTSIIIPAFNALLFVFDTVAAALNGVFGTEFNGAALLATTAILGLLGVFSLIGSAIGAVVSGGALLISAFLGLGPAFAVASGFFSALIEGATVFGALIVGLVGWPALIVAGLVLAGAAVVIFWDDISKAAQDAYNFIAGLWSESGAAEIFAGFTARSEQVTADARDQAREIGESFQRGWAMIGEGAGTAFDSFTERSEQVSADARVQADAIGAAFAPAWDGIATGAQQAWDGVVEAFTGDPAATGPAWQGITEASGAAFTATTTGAAATWEAVLASAQSLPGGIGAVWEAVKGVIDTAWAGLTLAAQFVWDGITGIFNAGAATVATIWQGIADTIAGIWDAATGAITASAQAIVDAIATATETAGDVEGAAAIAEGLVAPFRAAQATITEIWAGIEALTETGFDGILAGADAAVAGIGRVAQQITTKLRSELEALISTLNAAMSRIISSINSAIARLKKAAAEARSSGGKGGDKGLARGGLIRGAGTGTSDSIPVRLSNGEFVLRAAAVRKYGVGLLRALNGLRASRDVFKGLVPGFAQGGLVSAANLSGFDLDGLLSGLAGALGGNVLAPRLAIAGGGTIAPQRSLRPISLTLPGGETFEMLADETVAEKVMRFATGSQLRTAGRKPGWAK